MATAEMQSDYCDVVALLRAHDGPLRTGSHLVKLADPWDGLISVDLGLG
jgi:hypothetical protein